MGKAFQKTYWNLASPFSRTQPLMRDECHFTILFALNQDLTIDGEMIKKDHYCFLPPLQTKNHSLLVTKKMVEFIILTVPTTIPQVKIPPSSFIRPLSTSIQFHLARFILEQQNPQAMHMIIGDAQYLIQLCMLENSPIQTTRFSYREIFLFLSELNQNINTTGAKLTVAQLARKSQLKTYRLQQICQQLFSMTAHQVLQFMKMTTALHFLVNQALTLNAIRKELHYSNDENFITAFRQYFYVTPHSFRKNIPLPGDFPFGML